MTDDELQDLLRLHESAGEPRFANGFSDRVMHRVAAAGLARDAATLDRVLARYARRVLPALAAASMVLAIWNYVSVRDRAPSTFGAVLGIASSSLATNAQRTAGAPANGLMNVEAFE